MERIITAAEVKNPVIVRPAKAKDIVSAVEGSEFLTAHRHGKQLFLELSRGGWLTWHFGMTGEPVFFDRLADEPPYDRFLFTFEHGYLAFDDPRMLGRIGVISSPDEFIKRKRLGPDALSVKESRFIEIFGKAKGAAKTALMDQRKLAGVGNIYSDEILFQCRMDPRAELSSLEESDLRCLHKAMRKVLLKSVEVGTDFKKLPQTYLLHYRRRGSECPLCGGIMETLTMNGRTAYYCPSCQRRGRE